MDLALDVQSLPTVRYRQTLLGTAQHLNQHLPRPHQDHPLDPRWDPQSGHQEEPLLLLSDLR